MPAHAGAAAPGPAVDLSVELRWLPQSADDAAAMPPGWQVSTLPADAGRAAGTLGWQAGSAQAGAATPWRTGRLRVLNGATGQQRLTHWMPQDRVAFVWAPVGVGSAAAAAPQAGGTRLGAPTSAAPGQTGLVGGRYWVAQTTQLSVSPRWPGGRAPVDLTWSLTWPDAAATSGDPAGPPDDEREMSGRALVPLGEWSTLAQARPDAVGDARTVSTRSLDAAGRGWRLQVRVTRR
jgi:hypothetical protein